MATGPKKRDANYREVAMAMEAHGVSTGRQTHGVEADVDMRGERLPDFDLDFATLQSWAGQTVGISTDLDLSQRPASSRFSIAVHGPIS